SSSSSSPASCWSRCCRSGRPLLPTRSSRGRRRPNIPLAAEAGRKNRRVSSGAASIRMERQSPWRPGMQGGPLSEVLRRLRSAAVPVAGGLADAELLRRWVAGRDEAAFEVLLWRHGPMVLSLCRRWLSRDDADDAFQAVFLALARKAG